MREKREAFKSMERELLESNEVLRQLCARKSVRAFEDRPISRGDRLRILHAATMAPTAGNQQLYTIIEVTDPSLLARLAVSCDDQPFIAQSKLTLIFCADCRKWTRAFEYAGASPRRPQVGDWALAMSDAVIAAQNAVTAAWSLGVGSCYIGDIMENCEAHRRMLKLPAYVFPAAMLVFGHPVEARMERVKPARAALEHIVHENAYREMDEGELREMFAQRAGDRGFDEWMRAFCARKYNSDFSREMSRSVAEYLRQYRPEEN